MNSNVVTEIVDNDICIGCGTCVAMCKNGALEIGFNKYGEYNPYFNKKNSCENCGYCLKFCPFFNENDNEDDISYKKFDEKENLKYSRFLGYYIDNYVGYSCVDDQRKNGASGGTATWILETALKKKLVDYVVCVSSNNDPEKLFDYNIYSDTSKIRKSSSSAYYPINLSNVLKNILNTEGRYFVIGPPCFIKSIRLAMQNNPKINSRITFLGGFVCGQLKNKNFVSNLALYVGMNNKISHVNFRLKDYKNPSNNYCYYFEDINNKNKKLNRFDDIFRTFNNRWFTPNACNFCDDIFAECSDITFMDAWLKDYIGDSKGNSIILIRSNRLNNLIKEGIKNQELKLKKLSLEDAIKAQIDNIDFKRIDLKYRLYLADKYDKINPKKRISPSNKLNILDKWSIINKNQLQKKSKLLFDKYVTNKNRYNTFLKKIQKYHNRELFRIYIKKKSKPLFSLLKKMIK